jgi:hypothetical protein
MPLLPSAREAGYELMTAGNAAKLDRNSKIRARIAWLTRQEEEVLREKRRMLEERQWLIHDADIGDFYEIVEEVAPRRSKITRVSLPVWRSAAHPDQPGPAEPRYALHDCRPSPPCGDGRSERCFRFKHSAWALKDETGYGGRGPCLSDAKPREAGPTS